jgi:hypothetical protein
MTDREFDDLDLDIEGDVFSEADLADADGFDAIGLPDGVDREQLLGELWRDLIRGEHARAVLAEAEMRRVIEVNRQLGEHRSIEGIGKVAARIPLDVYLHWVARYGSDFWAQRDSLDFLAARNPGMLVGVQARGARSVFDMGGASGK